MKQPYLGQQGDIVLMDFMPSTGTEINKRRPAVIVSNDVYNTYCRARIVCPIRSTINDFPLHVVLDERTETQGEILCEQLKALDVESRHIKFLEKLPDDLLEEVLDIVQGSIEREV